MYHTPLVRNFILFFIYELFIKCQHDMKVVTECNVLFNAFKIHSKKVTVKKIIFIISACHHTQLLSCKSDSKTERNSFSPLFVNSGRRPAPSSITFSMPCTYRIGTYKSVSFIELSNHSF